MSHTQQSAYPPTHKVRLVTAASGCDGHDAAINMQGYKMYIVMI